MERPGNSAHKLLHRSRSCDLRTSLQLSDEIMIAFDVVLYPTDFSPESQQAFQLACTIARDHFARLVVVHVLPHSANSRDADCVELVTEKEPDFCRCRDQFQILSSLAGDVPVTFRLVTGYPVGSILKVAVEEEADLIVIASEQQQPLPIQLHGSVAEGVLRQAHCPVCCLRQPTSRLRDSVPAPASRSARSPSQV